VKILEGATARRLVRLEMLWSPAYRERCHGFTAKIADVSGCPPNSFIRWFGQGLLRTSFRIGADPAIASA